jgi:hypothetical protein
MILSSRLLKAVVIALPAICLLATPSRAQQAGNDLDQFMAQVLARRDDNWRKLQQYVLDERETADFLGPGKIRLFAMDREYEWYIRDGVFVRSPVKFDGVTLSEDDRRKAEQEWIGKEKDQQKNDAAKSAAVLQGAPAPDTDSPASLDSILKSTREPQFVSAAYFMRFKFEPGHYAFVGPETYEGRQVLRIEYYPRRLYDDDGPGDGNKTKDEEGRTKDEEGKTKDEGTKDENGQKGQKDKDKEQEFENRINRQMNKTALVTLWIEPTSHQIVQYRFENLPLDFMPARSIVRVEGFGATMKMGQPFPGVWLPQDIDASGSFTMALGTCDAHYAVRYRNYREASVGVKIK